MAVAGTEAILADHSSTTGNTEYSDVKRVALSQTQSQ